MRAALLGLVVISLAGCPGPTGDCDLDVECAGGEVCANNHDCVPAGTTYALAIRWTLAGNPASIGTCGLIDRLELRVTETATGDFATYAPVPCEAGQFSFAKLPAGFDQVRLVVFSDGVPAEDHQAAIGPTTGSVTFDLETAVPPAIVDAGVRD